MSNPSINGAASANTVFYARQALDTDMVSNDPNNVDFGIYFTSAGSATRVFVEGDIAPVPFEEEPMDPTDPFPFPDPGPDYRFSQLGFHPAINDAGQVAFYARIAERVQIGSDIQYINPSGGIWSGLGANYGTYRLVAMHGDQAPGLPAGVVFSGFGDPVINATGQLAFVAYLAGAGVNALNDFAVYRATPDGQGGFTLELIAREGFSAPGTIGFYAGDLPNGSPFRDPFINASGQVAFQANWHSNPGSFGSGGPGIWLNTPGVGNVAVAARRLFGKGIQTISLGSGEASGAGQSKAASSGGQDGRGTALNDNGEVVFVVRLQAIPELDRRVVVASHPSPIMLATDFNADGFTDSGDLALLFEAFDTQNSRYDINADGVIDMRDVSVVLNAMTSR